MQGKTEVQMVSGEPNPDPLLPQSATHDFA
jgi:hypothetical protein